MKKGTGYHVTVNSNVQDKEREINPTNNKNFKAHSHKTEISTQFDSGSVSKFSHKKGPKIKTDNSFQNMLEDKNVAFGMPQFLEVDCNHLGVTTHLFETNELVSCKDKRNLIMNLNLSSSIEDSDDFYNEENLSKGFNSLNDQI